MLLARSPLFRSLPWLLLRALYTTAARAEPEGSPPSSEAPPQPAAQEQVARSEGETPAPREAEEPEAPAEEAAAEETPSAPPAPPEALPEIALPPAPPPSRSRPVEPAAENVEEKKATLEPSAAALPSARSWLLLELDGGVNLRLGESPGLRSDRRFGGAFTLGLWGDLGERLALGLELQHTELGGGSARSALNLVDHDFSVETAWLSGRFIPIRGEAALGFLALRAGLAAQRVTANGVRQVGGPLEPARGFRCSELDGPDLAFGAGVGARFGVGPGFAFITRLDGAVHRLSSEPVRECATGTGSSQSVTASVGVAYGL